MISVVLLMAGSATRMKRKENKVYLPLKEKMVYEYALQKFLDLGTEVICVIRKEDRDYLKPYFTQVKIVLGGTTRQESVYKGVKEASGEFVLIHDAARPFVSKDMILHCIDSMKKGNCCLVVAPSKDTVYQKNPLRNLKREELVLAQTPQGGRKTVLLKCHEQAIKDRYFGTDDISLVLKYSDTPIQLIEGSDLNFKITTQMDYIIAKELVKND